VEPGRCASALSNEAKAGRAMQAMMKMKKLYIAALKRARDGG
jgi:predicted 3-demethylubiquinone-9 3-methyltransferase (glyoxalase superfamily)